MAQLNLVWACILLFDLFLPFQTGWAYLFAWFNTGLIV
jgi:hypothetical protein